MLSANKHLNPNGTGMGLNICKRIAERMGGKVWVKSCIDRGSVFGFSFKCEIPDKREIESAGFRTSSRVLPVVSRDMMFESEEQSLLISGEGRKEKIVYGPVKGCKSRILVADDMVYAIVAVKALFVEVFKLDSYVVTYVRDGYEAVNEIRKNLASCDEPDYRPFSLLILDFNMPFLDGL